MKKADDPLLKLVIDVDQKIAAGNQVNVGERRIFENTVLGKHDAFADFVHDAILIVLTMEKSPQAFFGNIGIQSSRITAIAGGSECPEPARLKNASGLAPAYIEVGELDIFRDEDIRFRQTLAAAGVSVELHVHPSVPHGFELFAPDAKVSPRAIADRVRILKEL